MQLHLHLLTNVASEHQLSEVVWEIRSPMCLGYLYTYILMLFSPICMKHGPPGLLVNARCKQGLRTSFYCWHSQSDGMFWQVCPRGICHVPMLSNSSSLVITFHFSHWLVSGHVNNFFYSMIVMIVLSVLDM